MVKLFLSFALSVQTVDGSLLTITNPFTCEFQIERTDFVMSSTAVIRIRNLSEAHAVRLQYNLYSDQNGTPRSIVFQAGYRDKISTCFSGVLTRAYSYLEGSSLVTQFECSSLSGGSVNAQTDFAYPKDTLVHDVISAIASSLPGVSIGSLGNFPGPLQRQSTYSGATMNLLKELTNGNFFVDNSKAYALNRNEYTEGDVTTLGPSSGIIGTPMIEQLVLRVNMIFDPRFRVGQGLTLQPIPNVKGFTGLCKVVGVSHSGVISDQVSAQTVTKLGLIQIQNGVKIG